MLENVFGGLAFLSRKLRIGMKVLVKLFIRREIGSMLVKNVGKWR